MERDIELALENLKLNQETLMKVITLNYEIQREQIEKMDIFRNNILQMITALADRFMPLLTETIGLKRTDKKEMFTP